MAICERNVNLIELFLREGSSINLRSLPPASQAPDGHDCCAISAIELACYLKESEILKLLVSYDETKKW